jgi:hypothetical protein
MNCRAALGLVTLSTISYACGPRSTPRNSPIPAVTADTDWLAKQQVTCGEVRGRVVDGRNGKPLEQAYVTLDSATRGVSTDTLGHFRLVITPFVPNTPMRTRATTLRIRRVGAPELRIYLSPNLGYIVEASLASLGFHTDHVSTVRIKTPGFCERAT